MGEVQKPASPTESTGMSLATATGSSSQASPPPRPKTMSPQEIYALPAPIRTFPLPTFYPNNPVSLLQLAWAWSKQVLFPPAAEPSVVWDGVWSPDSRSVHVVDAKAIRALWEQGFYGKGNLSRSEPNWLKREKVRRGIAKAHVSEEHTVSRREERNRMKWERARAEQDAIRQTRLEEARQAIAQAEAIEQDGISPLTPAPTPPARTWAAPTGPTELLALPNSSAELEALGVLRLNEVDPLTIVDSVEEVVFDNTTEESFGSFSPLGIRENGAAIDGSKSPNGISKIPTRTTTPLSLPNGSTPNDGSSDEPQAPLKRRKSVRFSPKVESATFQLSDPPSPGHALLNGKTVNGSSEMAKEHNPLENGVVLPKCALNGVNGGSGPSRPATILESPKALAQTADDDIVDKEHLQLTAEEAFFLVFGLGALRVQDPETKEVLDTRELFRLFRRNSSFPTRAEPDLRPDDGFLVHYAVYHHFRSLGWVPRPGIKFGMDWMLYAKGPVFDHAPFGLIVMPAYTDARWEQSGLSIPQQKSWHWLHGVLRVLAHVQKSLVIVYVDVPPPSVFDEACAKGPVDVFKLYKVREVMIKRWSANRNR